MGYHHGDLREALILAGIELIAEKGFAGLSVAEAARRTGVSAAAPYRHFANRDAFLLAIATEAGVTMGISWRPPWSRSTTRWSSWRRSRRSTCGS